MAISINPVLPVLAAQEAGGIAPELVLQPGSVVNAQVLKVLSADLVRIAIASLSIDAASNRPAIVLPKNVLTPLERTAVSAAAQAAVTEQDSLAPLFANLGAAVSSSNLPPKLQAAIAQVLAQQTSLDQ